MEVTMPRHHNGWLQKDCDCSRKAWRKCAHSWQLAYQWRLTRYRVSLDKERGRPLKSKTEATMERYRAPDVTIRGTVDGYELTPITPAGGRWLDIQAEAHGWAWDAGVVVVRGVPDARAFVETILGAGLMVADTIRPTLPASRTESGEWLQ
jgi:hypothetical protein